MKLEFELRSIGTDTFTTVLQWESQEDRRLDFRSAKPVCLFQNQRNKIFIILQTNLNYWLCDIFTPHFVCLIVNQMQTHQ